MKVDVDLTLLLQKAMHVSSVAHPMVLGNKALATIPGITIRNRGRSFKYPANMRAP